MNEQDKGPVPFLPDRRSVDNRYARDKWRQYEYLKSMLPIDLSSAEYEAQCQRIARELGI